MARVVVLAAWRRFDEAETQLRALDGTPTVRSAADLLDAVGHYAGADDVVFAWFCRRTRDYWYAWGAEATGGGEGLARLLRIEPAMERLRRLEQRRMGV